MIGFYWIIFPGCGVLKAKRVCTAFCFYQFHIFNPVYSWCKFWCFLFPWCRCIDVLVLFSLQSTSAIDIWELQHWWSRQRGLHRRRGCTKKDHTILGPRSVVVSSIAYVSTWQVLVVWGMMVHASGIVNVNEGFWIPPENVYKFFHHRGSEKHRVYSAYKSPI